MPSQTARHCGFFYVLFFPRLNIKSHITQYTSEQYSLLEDFLPLCHLEHSSLYCVKN
jgi:hypothetical protein